MPSSAACMLDCLLSSLPALEPPGLIRMPSTHYLRKVTDGHAHMTYWLLGLLQAPGNEITSPHRAWLRLNAPKCLHAWLLAWASKTFKFKENCHLGASHSIIISYIYCCLYSSWLKLILIWWPLNSTYSFEPWQMRFLFHSLLAKTPDWYLFWQPRAKQCSKTMITS